MSAWVLEMNLRSSSNFDAELRPLILRKMITNGATIEDEESGVVELAEANGRETMKRSSEMILREGGSLEAHLHLRGRSRGGRGRQTSGQPFSEGESKVEVGSTEAEGLCLKRPLLSGREGERSDNLRDLLRGVDGPDDKSPSKPEGDECIEAEEERLMGSDEGWGSTSVGQMNRSARMSSLVGGLVGDETKV